MHKVHHQKINNKDKAPHMSVAGKSLQSVQASWFDEFIASVRTHQLLLETNTATDELKSTYDIIMKGSSNDLAHLNKVSANTHFIKRMVIEYLESIQANMPLKMAFDMDNTEILVWAELADDDEAMEDFLLMAEADVNARYHQYGYDLTSTIVEQRDRLSIPNHYAVFKS